MDLPSYCNDYVNLTSLLTQAKWIGGYKKSDGSEIRGFDTIKEIMGSHFELVEELEMPFIIRETARSHEWTVSHATVWKRNTTPN